MTDNIITVFLAVMASQGLWTFLGDFLRQRYGKKTILERLVLGMAHDRLHFLCAKYIKEGSMTPDEYDTLKSIAEPYLEMGGNGSGKRLYDQAAKLPIVRGE